MRLNDVRLPLMALAALVYARLAGGRLAYLTFYLLAGVVIAAWFWVRSGLASLSCTYTASRRQVSVGEPVMLRLRIYNEGFLPVPWVEVHEPGKAEPEVHSVGGLASSVRATQLVPRRRGTHALGPLELRLGDAFGIFTARKRIPAGQRVTVYPRLVPLDRVDLPLRLPFGGVRTRRRSFEDLTSPAEIRPFRPGDNPRQIHWKVSAHRSELQVREFELSATANLLIFLDLQALAYRDAAPDLDERAVEVAAAIARHALRSGLTVALTAYSRARAHVPPGHGSRQLRRFLEVLATTATDGTIPAARALLYERAALPPQSALLVITPRVDLSLAGVLLQLRTAGFGVVLAAMGRQAGAPARADLLRALKAAGVIVWNVDRAEDLARPEARVSG